MEDLIRRTMGSTIEVDVLCADDLWQVCADTVQLESALLNVCINARDAMAGGGELTIEMANVRLDQSRQVAGRQLSAPALSRPAAEKSHRASSVTDWLLPFRSANRMTGCRDLTLAVFRGPCPLRTLNQSFAGGHLDQRLPACGEGRPATAPTGGELELPTLGSPRHRLSRISEAAIETRDRIPHS